MALGSDRNAVVLGVVRTPFGRFGGALAGLDHTRLGGRTIDALLGRMALAPEHIDAAYVGVGMIAAGLLTPVRQIVIASSLPDTTPSLTVDRACCSGMTAIGLGLKDILLGAADCVLCGGVESLSTTPLLIDRDEGECNSTPTDPLRLRAPFLEKAIAAYTGEEALRFGVSREEQDAWALQSHGRYHDALARGFFEFERLAVTDKNGGTILATDESPRSDTSMEQLTALNPIYGSPTVTPGNAPGLNDGAAFLVLASEEFARAHGLPELATITGYVQIADGPTSGSYAPALAIQRLLDEKGLRIDDLAQIEINEAFAATPLVSALHLSQLDKDAGRALHTKVNPNGGAVAIGHPLGASGARLAMTLIAGLRESGGGVGAAAICGGFGQGDAITIEVRP